MNKTEVLGQLQNLKLLQQGKYIIMGSATLAIFDIRLANDIEIFASPDLIQKFKNQGWKEFIYGKKGVIPESHVWKNENFEATSDWNYGNYNPSIDDLLTKAVVIKGIPFASLQDIKEWKQSFGREKDLKDVELIN